MILLYSKIKKRTGVSMKELMLGEEPSKEDDTSKTVSQHKGITVNHNTSKPVKQVKIKKVTYYIKNADLIKKMKLLGVEKERDLSSLVTEAIEDLIKNYKR